MKTSNSQYNLRLIAKCVILTSKKLYHKLPYTKLNLTLRRFQSMNCVGSVQSVKTTNHTRHTAEYLCLLLHIQLKQVSHIPLVIPISMRSSINDLIAIIQLYPRCAFPSKFMDKYPHLPNISNSRNDLDL